MVVRKADELGVLGHTTTLVSLVTDDDGLHLVEQQLTGHATEELKRPFQALEHLLHRLTAEELQPQDAREPQYNQERIALAPRKSEVSEIDLTLVTRRCLEPHDRIRRRPGTDLTHILLELCVATPIAGRPDLVEKPDCRQLCVGLQPCLDDAFIGIQLRGLRHSRPIADQLLTWAPIHVPDPDPPIDRTSVHAQFAGDGRLRHALFEIVSEQHVLLPSVHRASDV